MFTEFMRFLRPPISVQEFAGATAQSISNGRLVFDRVGCALCHTPSLRTGNESDLSTLNRRDAALTRLCCCVILDRSWLMALAKATRVRSFRSAPLWGIGQRVFFLHDGRTTDLLWLIGTTPVMAKIDRKRTS